MIRNFGVFGLFGILGVIILPWVAEAAEIEVLPQSTPKFIPPHTGGDQEFNGHGPVMKARVDLLIRDHKLVARVYLHAKETQQDNTEAEGHEDYVVYDARKVVGFANGQQTESRLEYTDTNHEDDIFVRGAAEPVAKWIASGDRKGLDAGIWTGVRVDFNRIKLIVE